MTSWFFDPLTPLHYELLVIDPPWDFGLYSDKGNQKAAQRHYSCMKDDEILAMPVGQLASIDCLLYLWATAPQLPLAIECCKAWGFEYKSFMVWRKLTPGGKERMGTGYRVRTTGEIVIVGALGNPKQSTVPRTVFDALHASTAANPMSSMPSAIASCRMRAAPTSSLERAAPAGIPSETKRRSSMR